MVIVSHSEEQIKKLCAYAIWLDGKTVAETGVPDEVLQQYNQAERQ